MNLNQNAKNDDYINAEFALSQIDDLRQQAQYTISDNMIQKHRFEAVQVDQFNQEEFDDFTTSWD